MYSRAGGDMSETFKHFHIYDESAISELFRPKEQFSRKYEFQLYNHTAKDGIRAFKTIHFITVQ